MSFLNNLENVVQKPQDVLSGVYSNTGFDMIQVLSRLINRPHPQIHLGPIDLSCSFVVSDAMQYDFPVIYCSPGFEKLTGYTYDEIVGKNCRFLQSPDGQVTGGSRRQHTDNKAVYYLKTQLYKAKEHQASIINYKKGGQPFVNLITVIPLFTEEGQVEYYVGLQIDLVEQPNSILEKMQNGTYYINYHQASHVIPPSIKYEQDQKQHEDSIEETIGVVDEYFRDSPPSTNLDKDPLGLLGSTSMDSGTQRRKEWNQLVLDQTSDFIHVVSLKGVFLYASSSSYVQLEYEPHELIGKSLTSFCHPSDIIPVMREIKEAAHNSNTDRTVNLIFRIRKKHTGYMWIDCKGRLHMDQNRARKCLILCGREYPVYNLSSDQVNLYPEEYWAKLSLAGLFLYVTERCQDIVGFPAESLKHESIFQYAESESITKIAGVLRVIEETRKPATIEHTLLSSKGSYVPVSSTFYPGDQSPSFILLQVKPIKEGNEEPLIYQIKEPNMFPELDVTRSTNWQYELHQLEQTNEKLKEQIERYESSNKRKPRKRSKTKHKQGELMCAICQTRDSPEWRKGPNGPKELCNACGLRFAKHEKHNKQ